MCPWAWRWVGSDAFIYCYLRPVPVRGQSSAGDSPLASHTVPSTADATPGWRALKRMLYCMCAVNDRRPARARIAPSPPN